MRIDHIFLMLMFDHRTKTLNIVQNYVLTVVHSVIFIKNKDLRILTILVGIEFSVQNEIFQYRGFFQSIL